MSNKMLIDASHPEETRVAVVRGNRIEEFDFESQEKKQLRGNIYLAKVTRVEPSLQAAFIDYGGNRHGFLAFSEIHPDYYQIPVADRQALLEAEAEEARASREVEDADDEADANNVEAVAEEKPKRKPRRRNKKASAETEVQADAPAAEPQNGEIADQEANEAAAETEAEAAPTEISEAAATDDASAEVEATTEEAAKEKPKPKRRTTRRKPKAAETTEAPEADVEATGETSVEGNQNTEIQSADEGEAPAPDENGSDDPTTMAAMVETDWISEPLPGDDDEENGDGSDTPQDEGEVSASEAEPQEEKEEEKPKKRRATRTRRKKTEPVAEEAQEEVAASAENGVEAQSEVQDTKEETPSDGEETGKPEAEAVEAAEAEATEAEAEATEAETEKPAKPRRRSRRKKPAAADAEKAADAADTENTDNNNDADDVDDDDVESVGQDDALEEAASPRKVRRQYKIQEVIKRRQILLVQVVKEERGNKGAALTTYLSLAGRYSVLMPNTARGGGISRKITNTADRKRLKAIAAELDVPEGMGVILRTAGAARTKVEIERDFQYLMRLWEQVRNLTLSSSAPCLVYEEGSLIKRSIRDLYDKDTGEIVVSGERGHKEATDFMGMLMPNRVKKVKLYKDSQAIFAKYGVETQLDNLVSPQVTLKSGGYLVINQTEALVAVDVNSGRATREHSIENTALQTNLEAAEEVARQLRLRDLAGLIVIDFIDMEERRNNRAVEKKLKDCLKNDRARIQVGRISHFGLLEMSRQRIRASVLESTMDACIHCNGVGYVRSESAIALHVFRALEEHVSRHRKWDALVRTTPAIAAHILNHKRASLVDLEKKFGIQALVVGDVSMHGQQFEVEKGDRARPTANQAAIGYDGDNISDDNDKTDEPVEEETGRSRKRSRKRGQKDRRNEEVETAETEVSADEQVASEPSAETSDESDEAPRKKRRRGNRGGRRRKTAASENETETTPAPEETSVEETASETTEQAGDPAPEAEPVSAEPETVEPAATEEVPEEKPARRSTRRKKAPVSPAPAAAKEADAAAEQKTGATEEPPRPKRRTTRRKPAQDTAVEMTAVVESGTTEVKVEVPATPQSEPQDETPEKPKRSGWWSRGGGFF